MNGATTTAFNTTNGSTAALDSNSTADSCSSLGTNATFLTPPRILIPKLVKSRDGWKNKAGLRKKRLKAARIRIRDLENSRDNWKTRVVDAESQLGELKKQLEQTQQELATAQAENDEVKKKLPPRT